MSGELKMIDLGTALEHHGVKGMKWGHRKAKDSDAPLSSGDSNRLNLSNPRVKKAALAGVAVTAIVAGAFVAHHFATKTSSFDPVKVAEGAEKVKKMLQEPTDIIYLSKPHAGSGVTKNGIVNTGFQFVSKGRTEDFFEIFDRAGLNSDSFRSGDIRKMPNGDVAAIIGDLMGRSDSAGRKIPHAILVPASKASGLDSIEDVIKKIGPELERRYQDFLEVQRGLST